MKVLYVIDALGEGGTELSLAELLRHLPAAGVEPSVALLRSRGQEGVEQQVRDAGVPVTVLDGRRGAQHVRALIRLIRAKEVELVHSMLYASNLRARLAGRITGTPVVNSLVNTTYAREVATKGELLRLKRRAARSADALTARWVSAFHAVSHAVRRDAVIGLGLDPSRVVVIPRGRERARLGEPSPQRRARVRMALGVDDDAVVFVNVGRQEPAKNQVELLRAFAEVRSVHREAFLLIAGREGTASAELRREIEALGLDDSVMLLGHRQDVPDVLAASDVFVLPSVHEGMPGAALEAMALGLPLVLSDIEPNAEIVVPGGNATLVPLGRPDLLAEALGRVLGSARERHQMGAESRRIFDERFMVSGTAGSMADLYRRVLAGQAAWAPPRPMPAERVHGVLVTFNRSQELRVSLDALTGQTRPLTSLTIVDNGSDGSTRQTAAISGLGCPIEVLDPSENLGPAGGFALAARHVAGALGQGDWVVFLDDDDPLEVPGTLEQLCELTAAAAAHQERRHVGAVGVIGARLNRWTGRIRRLTDQELVGTIEVDYVPGGHGLMVAAPALADAGAYDAGFFYGLEELEFGMRLQRFGYRLVVDGERFLDARIAAGRTGPKVPRIERIADSGRRYYAVRNQIVIMRRYGRAGSALAVTGASLAVRPIADLLRRRSGTWSLARATARGVCDGWMDRLGARAVLGDRSGR